MGGEAHRAIAVNGAAQAAATRREPAKIHRRGEPKLHMTESMRRLSTPISICRMRAEHVAEVASDLPPGLLLDPACGSGVALATIIDATGRVGMGVELDQEIAGLAAANANRLLEKGKDPNRLAQHVIAGDGLDADGVMSSLHTSLIDSGIESKPPIAMLMVDPARPADAQNHTLEEMQPPLEALLTAWHPYMSMAESGPALLLDLSPRLSDAQCREVESIVERIFPGVARTWERISKGDGRIDRLSLWTGPLSRDVVQRVVRLGARGAHYEVSGDEQAPFRQTRLPMPISFDRWVTIVDSALVGAGLHEAWATEALGDAADEVDWMRTGPRRPLMVTDDRPRISDEAGPFAVVSGRVIHHRLSPPSMDTSASIAEAAKSHGLSKVQLRCGLDPEVQPKVQRSLNRRLKGRDGPRGFIVDVPVSRGTSLHSVYVLCSEE